MLFIEASTELFIDALVEQMKDAAVTLSAVTSHKHGGKLVTPLTPANALIKSLGTSVFSRSHSHVAGYAMAAR